jgi:hypothetical protein
VVGREHQERAIIASNGSGKTSAVCYELTCHLMGWYPDWWIGRHFDRPTAAWAAGEDTKSVRESLQVTLLGPPEAIGRGLIPGDRIANTTARGGVPDPIDSVTVQCGSGTSRLVFNDV